MLIVCHTVIARELPFREGLAQKHTEQFPEKRQEIGRGDPPNYEDYILIAT